jgi:hypothetical protein
MCDEDEQLIRYYFGELPDAERAEFERRLANEPALALRLKSFGECVESHDTTDGCGGDADKGGSAADAPERPVAAEQLAVPANLADRTANAILAGHWERATECVGSKRYSLADVAVVGVVAALLGMLIFPAIATSRESARRVACQNNLQEIYRGLALYRDDHGSRFPEIAPADNAGLFTVALAEPGYLDRDWLQSLLVCGSSDLSRQLAEQQVRVVVPTRDELRAASAAQLWQMRQLMAGSYAYRIGYMTGRGYVFPKCQMNCRTALMADAPVTQSEGLAPGAMGAVSLSHDGEGQNVLFEDGHVSFVTGYWAPDKMDHLYLNDVSQIAAGRHPDDVVLAPSEATPLGIRLLLLGN